MIYAVVINIELSVIISDLLTSNEVLLLLVGQRGKGGALGGTGVLRLLPGHRRGTHGVARLSKYGPAAVAVGSRGRRGGCGGGRCGGSGGRCCSDDISAVAAHIAERKVLVDQPVRFRSPSKPFHE